MTDIKIFLVELSITWRGLARVGYYLARLNKFDIRQSWRMAQRISVFIYYGIGMMIIIIKVKIIRHSQVQFRTRTYDLNVALCV